MAVYFFLFFVAGPIVGWVLYGTYSFCKSLYAVPEPAPYWEQPAGRIHLFQSDRYLDSDPDNPYENAALNWADGRIGCALAVEVVENPQYQPALIGTIQVLKPEQQKGIVAVILDNEKVTALGLPPAGLTSGAQMVVDRGLNPQTLHVN